MNWQVFASGLIGLVLNMVATAARADISEATYIPQGSERFEAVSPEHVSVYAFPPPFKYRVVGKVEAIGLAGPTAGAAAMMFDLGALLNTIGHTLTPPTEKDDIDLAMKALKREAAANGADNVLIIQSVQERVSDTTTQRRIHAVAFRRAD